MILKTVMKPMILLEMAGHLMETIQEMEPIFRRFTRRLYRLICHRAGHHHRGRRNTGGFAGGWQNIDGHLFAEHDFCRRQTAATGHRAIHN